MKKLLVFGAGELQESLILNAKELGIFTVGIDPNPNASAKSMLDKFEDVDGSDFEKTCEIVEKYKIDGIITTATDKPLLMMARIAEKYNFKFPMVSSITKSTNKFLMKNAFIHYDVPCAKGELIKKNDGINSILSNYNFPVIIKPTDSSGSRGVFLCNSFSEVLENFSKTSKYSSNGDVLIEEFIDGNELSVEGLVYNEKLHIIQITDKIVSVPPYNVEMGHSQPANINERQKEVIKIILEKAVIALELNNCAIHAEIKLSSQGPKIIEIGARLGGDYITSHLVPLSCGINMEKNLCKIALGELPNIIPNKNDYSMIVYLNLKNGTVKKLHNFDEIKKITNMFILKLEKETEIKAITNSLERYGHYIVSAEKLHDIMRKKDQIKKIIKKNIIIN